MHKHKYCFPPISMKCRMAFHEGSDTMHINVAVERRFEAKKLKLEKSRTQFYSLRSLSISLYNGQLLSASKWLRCRLVVIVIGSCVHFTLFARIFFGKPHVHTFTLAGFNICIYFKHNMIFVPFTTVFFFISSLPSPKISSLHNLQIPISRIIKLSGAPHSASEFVDPFHGFLADASQRLFTYAGGCLQFHLVHSRISYSVIIFINMLVCLLVFFNAFLSLAHTHTFAYRSLFSLAVA